MTAKKAGTHLSKNVLQMKFMQRSVLRIEKEQNEEEQQKVIDDEHWVLDIPDYKTKESLFLQNQSYVVCEGLRFGRQSYQGFNPEIEKIMRLQNAEEEAKRSEEIEKQNSVSDQEMVNRYSSLMGVIAKKFAKKRNRNDVAENDESGEPRSKKTFMKPSDD
ncbi:M-phase phosphoprotein 6-like [Physella acuta]|uniref:M-phase phosphoprotein 6-like n=1 Tax=Physella acuta TaxID=109671 RepID=UPI0027DB3A34|nr:M-phase phosphoprotein 6-like [Physella acuta]